MPPRTALVSRPRAGAARAATPPAVVRLQLVGANPAPAVTGHEELPGTSHYLIDRDPQRWRTDIPHYGKVTYAGVYPGVDLVYHGCQGQLAYDFVVHRGRTRGPSGWPLPGRARCASVRRAS